jgi:hypothetical protein
MSTADHKSPLLNGNGILQVTTFVPPVLAGDYNGDHVVDAADYTMWRDSQGNDVPPGSGADGTGPEGIPDGVVDQLDYDLWKSNFGNMFGADGTGSADESSAIPEPSAIGLVVSMMAFCLISPRNCVPAKEHVRIWMTRI